MNLSDPRQPGVISYIRFSSPAQRKGDSQTRQLQYAGEYAAKAGLPVLEPFGDLSISGFRGRHRMKGDLARFLAMVKSGEIPRGSHLVLESLDRLTRESEMRSINLLSGIVLEGIRVVTTLDDAVYDENATSMDIMRAVLVAGRAADESRTKSKRVAHAHANSKRRAREEGRVWHKGGPSWLTPVLDADRKIIKFEADDADPKVIVVRRIFVLLDQGMGTDKVAQLFNAELVPTFKHATKWGHSAILGIAKSRTVLGEYQPMYWHGSADRSARRTPHGEPIPNYYPAIIDPALFHRVQSRIAARRTKANNGGGQKGKAFTNLIIGLGVCASCGGRMGYSAPGVPAGRTWKKASVLTCSNRVAGCDHRTRHPYAPIEAAILSSISELDLTGEAARSPAAIELDLLQARLSGVAGKLSNLADSEAVGSRTIAGKIAALEAEEDILGDQIKALTAKARESGAERPVADHQEAVRRLHAELAGLEGDSLYARRAALSQSLRGVIDRVVFDASNAPVVLMMGGKKSYRLGEKVLSVTRDGFWNGKGPPVAAVA